MSKKLLWLFGSLLIIVLILNAWLIFQPTSSPAILGDQVEEIINQEIAGEVADKPALIGVDDPLLGHSWKIVSLVDGQEIVDAIDYDLRINFLENQISGKICNQFSASYKLVDGNNLVADGPLTSTEMACEGDIMKIESILFQLIQKGLGYSVAESGVLTLTGGDGQVIGLIESIE